MDDSISRRKILLRGLQLVPVGGVLLSTLAGCGWKSGQSTAAAGGTVCADPGSMNDTELGTRRSVHYTEQSPNPQQTCSMCAFFHPGADGGPCGTCDIMSGGPVNSGGHCDSWSAKA